MVAKLEKIHTHYDNLKVTRNAPPEVIRAAYKILTQKYHPDKHFGNSDAERVMSLINVSYEVLSNPEKRTDHDRWIDQQEKSNKLSAAPSVLSQPIVQRSQQPIYQKKQLAHQPLPFLLKIMSRLFSNILRNWLLYVFVGFGFWIWATGVYKQPSAGPRPYQSNQAPASPAEVKAVVAPNGQPWPIAAGYVKDYQQSHTNGLSTVTVDNSRNDSEVFVKLVSLDSAQAYPVRQFYIPAYGNFTLKKVTAGSYDIRYRDLRSGGLSRSDAITLSETHTDKGTQYSNLTITLYKVKNGNMKTYGLPEKEF